MVGWNLALNQFLRKFSFMLFYYLAGGNSRKSLMVFSLVVVAYLFLFCFHRRAYFSEDEIEAQKGEHFSRMT